jgi:hypothetical protein
VTRTDDLYREPGVIATVESTWASHEFSGEAEVRAKRQMPPNLNVTLNLNMQLPQGINAQQLPAALQQMLQQAQQAMLQAAQQAVQEALKEQAPLAGFEVGFRGGTWTRSA